MTGRAKGRIALVGLVLVLLGFGVALATSEAGRVHFLTWRMRSGDLETRQRAREKLLAIGRPAIDRVFPELVVSEIRDRHDLPGPGILWAWTGCVARLGGDGSVAAVENFFRGSFRLVGEDPRTTPSALFGPAPRPSSRIVVAGRWLTVLMGMHGEDTTLFEPTFVMELPADEDLAERITGAVREEWRERRW